MRSLAVQQKLHRQLAEEENFVKITEEIVKVIDLQTKKLGTNEAAIQKTLYLILNKALPPNIRKLNALLFLERMVRFDRTFNKAFLVNLAKIIGFISKVGGLTKFTEIAD